MSKRTLTTDEALSLVINKPIIHTFVNPAPSVFIGADWTRSEIEQVLTECPCELAGRLATNMGHGIAANRPKSGFVFIETDAKALAAFDKEELK